MARQTKPLSVKEIESAKPKETDYVLYDGDGLELLIKSEGAGIAVCLVAYSHHACRTECDAMTEHYWRLRDYALHHPECSAIMRIID